MLSALDSRTRRLYLLLLVDFAAYGALITIFGAALPRILDEFRWSYTLAGVVLAAGPAGFFTSTLGCGLLLQRVRPKPLFLIGLALGGLSIGLFARFPSPLLNFFLNLVVGISQGFIEVVTELEVVHMEKRGQSRLMNLLHAGFCVGAIAGPATVGALERTRAGWSAAFPAFGVLLLLLLAVFSAVRFPEPGRDRPPEARGGMRAAREPLVLLLAVALFVYVGSELGLSSWTSEYFVKILGAPAAVGAFSVSVLWVGMMCGRLLISFGYRGTRQDLILLVLGALCSLGLAGILLAHTQAAVMILVFATGLGYSGVYPLAINLVGRHHRSGVAIGAVSTGAGIGSLVFPFIMAVISQRFGLRSGYLFYLGLDAVFVVFAVVVIRVVRRLHSA